MKKITNDLFSQNNHYIKSTAVFSEEGTVLNPEQHGELMAEAGFIAMMVFNNYAVIADSTEPYMPDRFISKLTGIRVRSVREARKKLTKTGWFKRIKSKSEGVTSITYFIGKDAVNAYNKVRKDYEICSE
jgi:hypothetical protein